MRVTSKGQVTIPIEIRNEFGLLPNTEVTFRVSDGEVILEKDEDLRSRGRRIVETMRGTSTVNMTTDEIMELTRGE